MNTGVISVRYASALLKLTQESGRGNQVCLQIRQMLDNPDSVPQPIEPDIEKLLALLQKNGRTGFLKFIFSSFVRMYYKSVGIRLAHLTSAVQTEGLEDKIRTLLEKQTGEKVLMDSKVDPGIVGGFIVEVDDYILDASVARQLELIRRQFASQNKKMV